MSKPRVAALLSSILLAACGGSSSKPSSVPAGPSAPSAPVAVTPTDPGTSRPVPGPVVEPRQVTAETALTTAWKATFTVPASWYVREADDLVRVEDPERELTLGFVAVEAADHRAAIAEAWKRFAPGLSLPVARDQELPGRDGWEAAAQIIYVTPVDQQRAVVAIARRLGAVWHVVVVDGKQAALQRRGAQVGSMIDDMKVPGLDEESYAGKAPVLDAERLARFDAFVEEARLLTRVPGVAVAVVHQGKVVLEKGHGVRSLAGKKKVTPTTLFEIGSTTKSLTTLLLARLIDDGKLTWETPVTEVLPEFALASADTTKAVTVQHTVCACTGMPRQDLEMLFEYAGWGPEERLASMKTMTPTTGFGETFQYSNLMVSTAGWIAARAYAPKKKLGPAYDEAMQRLVFAPAGMTSTTFDLRKVTRGDFADTHGSGMSLDHVRIPVEYEAALQAVRPAGAAWSNLRDLSRWVMLELGKGKLPGGKQLVSEENLLRRWKPQVKITEDAAYGLGMFIEDDHGVQVVGHGGNTLGHTSDVFMLPEHGIGVIVLTNAGGANAFRAAVRRAFMEIVFDGKPQAKEDLTSGMARAEANLADELKLHQAPDAAWIDPLLGTYEAPGLGRITLARAAGKVVLDAGEWKSEVDKKTDRDGTVLVSTIQPPYVGLDLQPKQQEGRTVLVLDAGQQVYTFVPVAAKPR